jgi:hypothetical protein
MTIVLVKRVLKLVFLAKDALSPLTTLLVTENPSIHVLRFDNKYPMSRHDDMINLRSSIRCLDSDVIDIEIYFGVEKYLLGESSLNLPDPTFDH